MRRIEDPPAGPVRGKNGSGLGHGRVAGATEGHLSGAVGRRQ